MNSHLTHEQMAQYKAIVSKIEDYRPLTDAEKETLIRDIMEKPFMDLLCDVAFKYVFSDPENLKMLLNDFLPIKIESVEPLPNELVSPVSGDKKPVMDILAKTDDGRKIIVEMQQERREAFFQRIYYYGSTLLSSQLKRGGHYGQLMPVYVICFMNFTTEHEGCPESQLVYEYQHREKIGGEELTNLHTTYLCELPRLAQKALKEMDPVESWFFILRNCSKFASKPEGLDSRYDAVIEAAKTNLVPDKERTQYLKAMLSEYDKKDIAAAYYKEGHDDGVKEGMKEGMKEEKINVARNLLALGMSTDVIFKVTGLSENEVKALAVPEGA